jgi:acetyltransferase-like isoleucine patch superfamily enzyme
MYKKTLFRIIFFLLSRMRICLYSLLSNQKVEGAINFVQACQVIGHGKIIVDENVKIGYFPSPHFFSTYSYLESRSRNSLIKIGENTHINNGFVAIAEKSSIEIGKNCLIGTHVEIYDSDFHSIRALDRMSGVDHSYKKVFIGNNVFIGSNVRILKGVTIGDGAVIANGAVVTRDIPSNFLAAGIPAKVIRKL